MVYVAIAVYSHGLYSYGVCRYVGMAYITMASIVVTLTGKACIVMVDIGVA